MLNIAYQSGTGRKTFQQIWMEIHIPWDDIFDYHPCRECIIYILLAGTIPWPGFPLPCYKHTGAYRHARKRCTYGSFMEGAVMQQW